MKIPFDIKYREEIESGKYKVYAADGHPVRIICWDAKNYWDTPIIGLYNNGEVDVVIEYNVHGAAGNNKTNLLIELRESEDEQTRKWILEKVQGYAASGIPCSNEIKMADKAIDWLINIPYALDHEKHEGFHIGFKAGLEKQKDSLHISKTCKENADSFTYVPKNEETGTRKEQKNAEWSEEDVKPYEPKFKPGMANVLDSLRPSWKPSEEQMKALQNAVALTACDKELVRLYNELKKL